MTKLFTVPAFDGDAFNFNFAYSTFVSANHHIGAHLLFDGIVYDDKYLAHYDNNTHAIGYLGTGFAFDDTGHFTAGTVQVIIQNAGQLDLGFYMTGVSVAATDLAAAAATVSTEDDYQIIAGIFSGADTLTLSAFGDVAYGYAGNDTIRGLAGDDKLDGGAGRDLIDGGDGADTMIGGTGNDTYVFGTGDRIVELAAGGIDRLLADRSVVLGANTENVTLKGTGHWSATGNRLDNAMTGNAASNTLRGGLGEDTLIGGGGADLIYGGSDGERDIFVLSAPRLSTIGAGHDTYFDFQHTVDDIYIKLMDADSTLDGNQDFTFHGKTAHAHSIWYTVSAGNALVQGDVNGDTTADFQISLVGVTLLGVHDFVL